MDHVELIGVPFDGYGRTGHQAAASEALRVAGLASAFGSLEVTDRGDLELPAPDPSRGAVTSLMNEIALLAMVERVGEAVTRAVQNGHFLSYTAATAPPCWARSRPSGAPRLSVCSSWTGTKTPCRWTCPRTGRQQTPRSAFCSA
jgi:hypothetical protein